MIRNRFFIAMVAFYMMLGVIAYVYQNSFRRIMRSAIAKVRFQNQLEEIIEENNLQIPFPEDSVALTLAANDLMSPITEQDTSLFDFMFRGPREGPEIESEPRKFKEFDDSDEYDNWDSKVRKGMKAIVKKQDKTQDLKDSSFKKQLQEHLQSHCKIALRKSSLSMQQMFYYGYPTHFYLEIDKGGEIHTLAITNSSGSPIIDQFMIETINQAAPFPPIPEHLGVKRYVLSD